MRKFVATAIGAMIVPMMLALAVSVAAYPEAGAVVQVVDFDVNPMFEVEGIAMSPSGDLYVGAPYEGEIFKVAASGEVSTFADLVPNPDDAYMLGLAVAGDGTVYAAIIGGNQLWMNGVWHVDTEGHASLVMAIPCDASWASIPNALAFDEQGNLYCTDSATGSVWRLGTDGSVEMWVQHRLLGPMVSFGANGITYRDSSLWVLNFEFGRIVQIPIGDDGSPGKPQIFVRSSLLVGADGGQFDVAGNMYVCNGWTNELLRVTKTGEISVLVAAEQFAPFCWPTNPVFGFGSERSTIYISGANPSVVKVDVKIPGLLMPQFETGS